MLGGGEGRGFSAIDILAEAPEEPEEPIELTEAIERVPSEEPLDLIELGVLTAIDIAFALGTTKFNLGSGIAFALGIINELGLEDIGYEGLGKPNPFGLTIKLGLLLSLALLVPLGFFKEGSCKVEVEVISSISIISL